MVRELKESLLPWLSGQVLPRTPTLAAYDELARRWITEVVLHPRITVGAAADETRARALVDSAHDGCFIANSVACTVRTEPEIVRAA